MGYAAYLFDMDGLLLDTERLFMQPFLELALDAGRSQDEAERFYLRQVGTSGAETLKQLTGFLPEHVDPQAFDAEWRQRYALLVEKGVPLRPFAHEFLTALNAQGARMAVVTSTHGVSARQKLSLAGLLSFFEVVKAGDEVSANKPDPAPYLEAAEALGVKASDCVAFEDSDAGTTAAVRAGCRTFQIPDLRPEGRDFPALGQDIVADLAAAAQKLRVFDPALTT